MDNECKECNVATCEYWATSNNCKKCENTCKYFGFGGCKLEMERCYKIDDCYYKQLLAEQAKNAELNGELVNKNQQLFKEQAKNKKLVEALENLANKCTAIDFDYCNNKCINGKSKNNDCYHLQAQQALKEVNK